MDLLEQPLYVNSYESSLQITGSSVFYPRESRSTRASKHHFGEDYLDNKAGLHACGTKQSCTVMLPLAASASDRIPSFPWDKRHFRFILGRTWDPRDICPAVLDQP